MHIHLDEEVVKRIDEVAGKRGRSAFIRRAIERELEDKSWRAGFERVAGSIPDFAPHMTPESIAEQRRRDSEERDRRLREHLARYDRPD